MNGFGSGPTSSEANASPNATLFAGVPSSSDSPNSVASTSTPADPAVTTTVWYGVCANTSTPAGTYTSQVTYTATVN